MVISRDSCQTSAGKPVAGGGAHRPNPIAFEAATPRQTLKKSENDSSNFLLLPPGVLILFARDLDSADARESAYLGVSMTSKNTENQFTTRSVISVLK